MNKSVSVRWLAVDWGTSNLRLWAMDEWHQVIDHKSSDQGMSTLTSDQYEKVLLSLISDWLPATGTLPVVICGMAGARQGWLEAPYRPTPTPLTKLAQAAVEPSVLDTRLKVSILPGLCQMELDSQDVMRGEETQILGAMQQQKLSSGLFCLPGTHSKWVMVEHDQVRNFSTSMTGELFQLLSHQSVLRFSMTGKWSDQAFVSAVSETYEAPAQLMARLFSVRSRTLLSEPETGEMDARLSGLLIGAELSGQRHILQKNEPVYLIGSDFHNHLYQQALVSLGFSATALDSEQMTLAGLRAAGASLIGVSYD